MGAGPPLGRTPPSLSSRSAEVPAVPAEVLVAEDDPRFAHLLEKALRHAGLHAHVVDNGKAAARAVSTGRFSLAILDLHDDGAGGTLSLLHQIRASGSALPVIVLGGWNGPRSRAAALAAGAEDYLPAPLRIADLFIAVGRLRRSADSALSVTGSRHALDQQLDALSDRLCREFAPHGGPDSDAVRATMDDMRAGLAAATVSVYLPIFVERAVRERIDPLTSRRCS